MSTGNDDDARGQPGATAMMPALGAALAESPDLETLGGKIIDIAVVLLNADCASIQTRVPEKTQLRLLAARGFVPEAEAFWKVVDAGSSSSCGQALKKGERVFISDIERSDVLAGTEDLRHLRLCGTRAVQSTPLVSRSGMPLGMFSTHWRREFQPDKSVLQLLDALAQLFVDLIERARSEEALRASEASLRLQVEALKRADRHKNDALAILAHELRHPIAPIHCVTETLTRTLHNVPIAQAPLATLRRQTDQLTRLIDDLLDVSRIERGSLALQEEEIEIGLILDQAIETAQPLIEQKRQHFTVAKPTSTTFVLGDRLRLVQCVSNLLDNAAKYTQEGGEIHATVREAGARVSIEIRDNGVGIAPELIPHIFDLYVRSTAPTPERSRGGLGIGLALVRLLIEMQGGSVEAASNGAGLGSTFTIHLWRAERSESAEHPTEELR